MATSPFVELARPVRLPAPGGYGAGPRGLSGGARGGSIAAGPGGVDASAPRLVGWVPCGSWASSWRHC